MSINYLEKMAERASAEGSSPGRPVRGILKKPASTIKTVVMESGVCSEVPAGSIRWDEINIMMTEHPEGKDYGHMKINEPKTPYQERMSGDEEDEEDLHGVLCADALAEKVLEARENAPRKQWSEADSSGGSDEEELSEEAKEHKKKFKEWRKKHYNEYQAVQRARALMQHDQEEEESEQSEQMQF